MRDSDRAVQTKTVEVAGKESGPFDVQEGRLFGLALALTVALAGLLIAETIPAGATIQAPISTSPTSVVVIVVPELVGVRNSEAVGDLTALGLQVSTLLADSNVARGQVIAQNPAHGETLLAGSTVTLTVSNGAATTSR